ncbi:glycoside hydrolase family 20 protein [Parabacteroides faecis]|uniref:glycoside hydrolase family 20 protein n=1 Tax=Parabacteroides faecis TaxID=1217282 RepID=UPI002164BD38|nr:glycoside hydrolase family 20 protein [Parabacteroides faecis]MCS2889938.1 glycoside hydrolase family 20 protein [Parabacteroides faecis]UVQ46362.1 glycoside hydrolase family 20 protein [Parabacteroides faecis]
MNKLSKLTLLYAAFAGMMACSDGKVAKGDYGIIPLPQEVSITNGGSFVLTPSTSIIYPEGNDLLKQAGEFLASYIKEATGYAPKVATAKSSKPIHLSIDKSISNPEGYRLTVTPEGIELAGATETGVFYGVQTLRKSIPAVAEGMNIELPAVTINDYPRFAYRGMHLDVSRHFFPADSVKKYIDILALHNMNTFHWHLTDDQGWRIEIKKYPELTKIGSQRKQTVIGHNSGEYDGKPYGGFYTQDEIRDVIAYAKERFITIIPEIDLPGHQQAALATYPELGCTGGPYDVWQQWGVSEDVICAGNEKSMQFLEDVLSEVIDLFPSEYIHIGGDECPKIRWKTCPKCQARIKAEGIKGDKKHSAEEYLQSSVISQMEKFVESKGRHIIGWDEILEGGLAPNATVMSWRGVDGGIEAAKQHHNVIMTPNTYLYFDYYQSTDTENEPMAIGGYLPLERVYSLEPTAGIPDEYKKYVIGVQANLWTEYIPTFSQVEYMVMPRMAALAEVQWTDPSKKEYQSFLPRLVHMTKLYDRLGYNYAKNIFDIHAEFTTDTENGEVVVDLSTMGDGDIYYTLDGSEPTSASNKYDTPVRIKENATIKAVVVRPAGNSRVFSEKITFSKSTAKPVTLRVAPSRGYEFKGGPEMTDGLTGDTNYKTGRWLGFQGKDLDAAIDLKQPVEISQVAFNTNVVKGDWIMGAAGVTVKVSEDGKNFKEIVSKTIPSLKQSDKDGIYPQEVTFAPVKARYVEVIIKSDKLPAWHGGAGNPAYLFVDEIIIQ